MGKTKAWLNGLFLAGTLVVNALGAKGLINGLTQKQVSNMYVTLITPSPGTFSIWGIIYSLLIASVIMMIVKQKDYYYRTAVNQISSLFWISCILNMAWIFAFSYVLIELSVLFVFALAVVLFFICQQLLVIQKGRRWLLPMSFGLYTGWLLIATIVNIDTALVKLRWNRLGISEEMWAIMVLAAAVSLVIILLVKNRNAVFPLPIAWAYWGIYRFLQAPDGFNGNFALLEKVSLAGMVVLIIAAAVQMVRNQLLVIPEAFRRKYF